MDYHTEVHKSGRITIPVDLRREMNLAEGDTLIIRYENGEMKLLTQQQLIAEAQAILRQYVPSGVSLVDELILERRAEAEREEKEFQETQKHSKNAEKPSA